MENRIRCNHCTKSFKSPTALRGHMKVHKQKKPSSDGGSGGMASSSSISPYNPKDEAGSLVTTTETTMEEVLDVVPLARMIMVGPSSHNNVAAGDHNTNGQLSLGRGQYVCVDCNMSFKSHHALGGHRSWKHSRKRLQLLLPAPNQSLLVRRSQRLRLFGVNLDVPTASS